MSLKKIFVLMVLVAAIAMINSCQKDEAPVNPFDNQPTDSTPQQTNFPDYSIQGLHKNIFAVKCASPGCHDGHFEPDYRTVQSTYSTLVFQKPIKNDTANSFKYRVQPFDTTKSWLHERLTTDDAVLGQMPLYSTPLGKTDMDNINKWIMDGAKDQFGNPAVLPALPNAPPQFLGYGAYIGSLQVDTNRMNGISYMPFIVNSSTNMLVAFFIADDSTDVSLFQVNLVKISTSKNDFTSAQLYQATYLYVPGAGGVWYISVDASTLPLNTILYMRYYVNDGNQPQTIEFPNNATFDYYKTYYAFYIVP